MSSSTKKCEPQNSNSMQWIATFAAFLLMLQVGIQYGWSSPNIPRLTGKNSPIPITIEEASWLVSLTAFGGIVGIIVAAASIEFFGSKRTVVLTGAVFSISHAFIICASSVNMLYVARTVGGIGVIFAYNCVPIYVGEISAPEIRGTLVSLSTAGYAVGIVFATIAETYVRMKITSAIYLVICIAVIILVVWLENTPYYFAKMNNHVNAKKSIAFYQGDDKDEKIFKDVEKFVEAQSNYTFKDNLRDFRLPSVRKSMILMAILATLGFICGQTTVPGYMETIFTSAKVTVVNPEQLVIYVNVITMISSLLTVKLMDIFGRKMLLTISSLGVTVAMTLLGTHFYLLEANYDPENLQWLPIFSIILYVIVLFAGLVPVPIAILSELFPENLKSIAALVASLPSSLFEFITANVYQFIVDSAGEMYVFWMYAAFALLITIPVVVFIMPETKGKSFQEIQDALVKK